MYYYLLSPQDFVLLKSDYISIAKMGLTIIDVLWHIKRHSFSSYFRYFTLVYFRLNPAEILFLKNYEQVMKPIAQALNIQHAETNHSNAYMGYLAPTISILREKLSKKLFITGVKHLVQPLLDGINKRLDRSWKTRRVLLLLFFAIYLSKIGQQIITLLRKVIITKFDCLTIFLFKHSHVFTVLLDWEY